VANVEAVAVLTDDRRQPRLAKLWELAESWWEHDEAVDWVPGAVSAPREVLEPALLEMIRAAVAADPEVATLGRPMPNHVREVTPYGVWVETTRSRRMRRLEGMFLKTPQP
jgi:hypothetical protein